LAAGAPGGAGGAGTSDSDSGLSATLHPLALEVQVIELLRR
jgi:hypothetical protein